MLSNTQHQPHEQVDGNANDISRNVVSTNKKERLNAWAPAYPTITQVLQAFASNNIHRFQHHEKKNTSYGRSCGFSLFSCARGSAVTIRQQPPPVHVNLLPVACSRHLLELLELLRAMIGYRMMDYNGLLDSPFDGAFVYEVRDVQDVPGKSRLPCVDCIFHKKKKACTSKQQSQQNKIREKKRNAQQLLCQ